jgi:hypothetical protein
MLEFFIYTVAENKLVGNVFAKDWIDARSIACKTFGYKFGEIFACKAPLPQ